MRTVTGIAGVTAPVLVLEKDDFITCTPAEKAEMSAMVGNAGGAFAILTAIPPWDPVPQPGIVIHEFLVDGLTPSQLGAILCHEQAHLDHDDLVVKEDTNLVSLNGSVGKFIVNVNFELAADKYAAKHYGAENMVGAVVAAISIMASHTSDPVGYKATQLGSPHMVERFAALRF